MSHIYASAQPIPGDKQQTRVFGTQRPTFEKDRSYICHYTMAEIYVDPYNADRSPGSEAFNGFLELNDSRIGSNINISYLLVAIRRSF